MRKLIFFLLSMVVILAACKKKGVDCPSDSYTYTFKDNAAVDTLNPYGASGYLLFAVVKSGSKRVFICSWTHHNCPNIQDGMGGADLVFEADPGVSYFKYYSDDLPKIKCYVQYSCYGCGSAYIPTGGIIEGTKLSDGKWKLSIDLKGTFASPITANYTAAN